MGIILGTGCMIHLVSLKCQRKRIWGMCWCMPGNCIQLEMTIANSIDGVIKDFGRKETL